MGFASRVRAFPRSRKPRTYLFARLTRTILGLGLRHGAGRQGPRWGPDRKVLAIAGATAGFPLPDGASSPPAVAPQTSPWWSWYFDNGAFGKREAQSRGALPAIGLIAFGTSTNPRLRAPGRQFRRRLVQGGNRCQTALRQPWHKGPFSGLECTPGPRPTSRTGDGAQPVGSHHDAEGPAARGPSQKPAGSSSQQVKPRTFTGLGAVVDAVDRVRTSSSPRISHTLGAIIGEVARQRLIARSTIRSRQSAAEERAFSAEHDERCRSRSPAPFCQTPRTCASAASLDAQADGTGIRWPLVFSPSICAMACAMSSSSGKKRDVRRND